MKKERIYLILKGKSVRGRFLLVVLLVALSTAWMFAASTAEAQRVAAQTAPPKVFQLKMQTLNIAVETLHSVYAKKFVEHVKQASNGQIDIKLFASGDIVPLFGMMDAVREGTLDLIHYYGGWWGGKIGEIAELETGAPAGFEKGEETDKYFEAGFADILRGLYRKQGVYYIGHVGGGSATIYIKKPVSKAADLRGVKVLESGIEARYFAELGAQTVPMTPMGEVYTAMATGIVDAAGWSGPRMMSKTLKLHEIAKYVFWPPTNWETRLQIVMNLRKWEELPDNLKKVLTDCVKEFHRTDRGYLLQEDREVLQDIQAKHGVKLVGVLPEERIKAAKAIRDEVAAKSPECARAIELERKLAASFGYVKYP